MWTYCCSLPSRFQTAVLTGCHYFVYEKRALRGLLFPRNSRPQLSLCHHLEDQLGISSVLPPPWIHSNSYCDAPPHPAPPTTSPALRHFLGSASGRTRNDSTTSPVLQQGPAPPVLLPKRTLQHESCLCAPGHCTAGTIENAAVFSFSYRGQCFSMALVFKRTLQPLQHSGRTFVLAGLSVLILGVLHDGLNCIYLPF